MSWIFSNSWHTPCVYVHTRCVSWLCTNSWHTMSWLCTNSWHTPCPFSSYKIRPTYQFVLSIVSWVLSSGKTSLLYHSYWWRYWPGNFGINLLVWCHGMRMWDTIVCVCVCVFVRLNVPLLDRTKTAWDKSSFLFIKTPSNGTFGNVVTHDIDLLLEGHGFDSWPFG